MIPTACERHFQKSRVKRENYARACAAALMCSRCELGTIDIQNEIIIEVGGLHVLRAKSHQPLLHGITKHLTSVFDRTRPSDASRSVLGDGSDRLLTLIYEPSEFLLLRSILLK